MTKPLGFYTNYTPGDTGLLEDMQESWGPTFEVLTNYQRAYLIAAASTEIFTSFETEDNDNDNEVEEACERLSELTLGELLGLLEALVNQLKYTRSTSAAMQRR